MRFRCRTVSYGEAVEIALCFGWIDSLARGHDEVSPIQRFSPRKPKSAWSKSNVERVRNAFSMRAECERLGGATSTPQRPTGAGQRFDAALYFTNDLREGGRKKMRHGRTRLAIG